jgi:glycosyltransferase involved in cell wall biosynthesis
MISVLLPTYNNADYLAQAIKSILGQTFSEFELLVLDDGSTDDTKAIVKSIDDPRIVYEWFPHQGLTKILNEGIRRAKYAVIARMDADDLSVPWRLENQFRALSQLPRNTILSSWCAVFSDGHVDYLVRTPTTSDEIKKGFLLHSYISHQGLMCYKNVLEENGGYCSDAEVDAFEDYQTWLKIKDNVNFHILREILILMRYRRDSLSNNLGYKQRIMYSIQQPYYDDLQFHFNITDHIEESAYRGWREYFYGSKMKAREYWAEMGSMIIHHPRIIIAWFVTFLPEHYVVLFKEARMRYRLQYYLHYYGTESRSLRKIFNNLVKQ